jgi:hypothetical protein
MTSNGWRAIWTVRTDSSELVELADGTFLAKVHGQGSPRAQQGCSPTLERNCEPPAGPPRRAFGRRVGGDGGARVSNRRLPPTASRRRNDAGALWPGGA